MDKKTILKNIRYILYILIILLSFSCSTEIKESKREHQERIIIIEQRVKNSQRFSIIKVDGIEYLVTDNVTIRLDN